MFFVSTFRHVRKWHKQFSHRKPFEQHSSTKEISTAEDMRLQKHHLAAVHEQQKVKRNYFLERRTFL